MNNPGFGSELGTYPLGRSNPAQPAAVRDYDGIEIRLRKRLANRWSADVSYLYSHLRGNWSGIASSDEAVGSLQPNSGRSFNLLYYSYDARGTSASVCSAPTGRISSRRRAPTTSPGARRIGVNALVESGVPKSTIMSQKNINFFPYGRGNLGRVPTFSQVDLLLQQEFRLPHGMRVTIGAERHQVFDQKTVTGYQTTPYRDQFNVSDATFFNGFDPGRRGDEPELPQGCALRHGQRLSGRPGDPGAGERELLKEGKTQNSELKTKSAEPTGAGQRFRRFRKFCLCFQF